MNTTVLTTVGRFLRSLPDDPQQMGILAACSGGGDSMALLAALHDLRNEMGFRLEAITIDHGHRPECAKECTAVQDFCHSRNIPFHLRTMRPPDSREDAMRSFRRSVFEQLLSERELNYVATGHTADDQAETILMRLIRGSGLLGLSGMRSIQPPYIKPVMAIGGQDLRAWLETLSIPWHDDPSNHSRDYFRNRVRHDLIPALANENPRIISTLNNTAETLSEEYDALIHFCKITPPPSTFDQGFLAEMQAPGEVPQAVFAHRIRTLFLMQNSAGQLERDHIKALSHQLTTQGNCAMALPGGIHIETIGKHFYMGPKLASPEWSTTLHKEQGSFSFDRGDGSLTHDEKGDIYIPSHAWPVTVRTKQPGDRLMRKGMGEVRLKKVLAHIPKRIKERLLVMTSADGRLIWVEGAGRSYGIEGPSYAIKWSRVRTTLPGYP